MMNGGSVNINYHILCHIFGNVVDERIRQEGLREAGKFKATCATRGEHQFTNDACFRVLGEEVGEVARALNEGSSVEHLREELVQVAAVCAAWIERIDVDCEEYAKEDAAYELGG